MHPFGGTPVCPKCSQPVYAAEQVMGPARKLYHKPCLSCTACNKRLDSFSLLEHEQLPYCKVCHTKTFGPQDLRQANLPHRPDLPPSPTRLMETGVRSASPVRSTPHFRPLSSPVKLILPSLRPTHSLGPNPSLGSPTTRLLPRSQEVRALLDARSINSMLVEDTIEESGKLSVFESEVEEQLVNPFPPTFSTGSSNTGRPGHGGIPRTVPLSPIYSGTAIRNEASSPLREQQNTGDRQTPTATPFRASPTKSSLEADRLLFPISTGTTGLIYGTALGSSVGMNLTGTSTPHKRWGAGTPSCPKCGKNVYFAEQVRAVGKTYHRGCLRCTECDTSLDSTRLRDHDKEPFCVRCYSKLYGPQGNGYALLGKTGG